jgi:hypothetical protein
MKKRNDLLIAYQLLQDLDTAKAWLRLSDAPGGREFAETLERRTQVVHKLIDAAVAKAMDQELEQVFGGK